MKTICILCPKGCELLVESVVGSHELCVTGNHCPKGVLYAHDEWHHPVRMLTTTVKSNSEHQPRVPVKTSKAIPKALIFQAMAEINTQVVDLPIAMGDVVVHGLLGLEVDVVVTMDII